MVVSAAGMRSTLRFRSGLRALPALALAALLGLAVESKPASAMEGTVSDLLPAFNQLCQELLDGRSGLQAGRLTQEEFVDLVLDLFTRADSLTTLLARRVPPTRAYTPATALSRGFRYLKDALRENYEGIVRQDGYRFVAADLNFDAALAWRSGVTTAELARP